MESVVALKMVGGADRPAHMAKTLAKNSSVLGEKEAAIVVDLLLSDRFQSNFERFAALVRYVPQQVAVKFLRTYGFT